MNDSHWFEIAAGAVMGAFAWLFKRHVHRVDDLEKTMARKEDFDRLADTWRDDVTAIHDRIDRKFDEQTNRIFEMLRDRQ